MYLLVYRYSHWNTEKIKSCDSNECGTFNVHHEHNDKEKAARTIQEIVRRNKILLNHLKSKYVENHFRSLDPNKNNVIDVISNEAIDDYIRERVQQLLLNYNSDQIYEISPLNYRNLTSYTENKRTLVLCLRKKEKNGSGENEIHDINTIMFVVIHELSHMMNNMWGHPEDYWKLFRFMLENAVEANVYKPINYQLHPVVYCGLKISYNPLF